MSGRKRGEVQVVLRNADKTRKELFENYFNDITAILSDFEKPGTNTITGETSSFSKTARKRFPEQVSRVENEVADIIKKVGKAKASVRKEERKKLDGFEKTIDETDKEVRALSSKINSSTNTHYMTKEYNHAVELLDRYNSVREQMSQMYATLRCERDRQKENFNNELNMLKRYTQLQHEIDQLNNMAEDLEREERVEELVHGACSLFAKIDPAHGERFGGKEYEDLVREHNAFVKGEGNIIETYKEHYLNIERVQAIVNEGLRQHLEAKNRADALYDGYSSFARSSRYSDPLQPAKKHTVMEFIQEYGDDQQLVKNVKNLEKQYKELYEREQYEKAAVIAEELANSMAETRELADNISIRMEELAQTVIAIEDVMSEMGHVYATSFERMSEGVTIESRHPGSIRFVIKSMEPKQQEGIKKDEARHDILDVQLHVDDEGSGCVTTAEGISRRLHASGIPLYITHWGRGQRPLDYPAMEQTGASQAGNESARIKEKTISSDNTAGKAWRDR